MKTAVEIAKLMKEGGGDVDKELLKEALKMLSQYPQLIAEKEKELLLKKIEDLEQRVMGPKDLVTHIKEEANFWRQVFGPSQTDPKIMLMLKKLELDSARQMTELQWQIKKWELEKQAEQQRMNMILQGLIAPLMGKLSPVIDSMVDSATQKLGKGEQVPQGYMLCPECLKKGKKTLIKIVDDEGNYLKSIKCPTCGAEFEQS